MACQGIWKSYNAAKGWGFITDGQGNDVFYHRTAMKGRPPVEGDILTFDLEESPTKPGEMVAVNITGGTSGGSQEGTVMSYAHQTGYGFIQQGDATIFVHCSDVIGGVLKKGDKVWFDIAPSPKNPAQQVAKNVAGGSGTPPELLGPGKGGKDGKGQGKSDGWGKGDGWDSWGSGWGKGDGSGSWGPAKGGGSDSWDSSWDGGWDGGKGGGMWEMMQWMMQSMAGPYGKGKGGKGSDKGWGGKDWGGKDWGGGKGGGTGKGGATQTFVSGKEADPLAVEEFILAHGLDERASEAMRGAPPAVQQAVIDRGDAKGAKNASSVVIGRLRDAQWAYLS